jgi:Yip1-like protein
MTDGPVTPPPPPSPPGGMPGAPASLVERVKNIIMTPKTEWPRIDAEPATISSLYTGYAMILAAIGPIAMIIGQQVFGYSALGFSYKPPIGNSIATAVLTYVMSLVGIYVVALIVNALAPSFGGTQDQVKAFKVAIYSWTAAWLAGIFYIFPPLSILVILGLYSLFLLYLGLPVLMRVTQDKAIGYTVVVIVAAIVVWIVISFLVGALVLAMFGTGMVTPVVRY